MADDIEIICEHCNKPIRGEIYQTEDWELIICKNCKQKELAELEEKDE